MYANSIRKLSSDLFYLFFSTGINCYCYSNKSKAKCGTLEHTLRPLACMNMLRPRLPPVPVWRPDQRRCSSWSAATSSWAQCQKSCSSSGTSSWRRPWPPRRKPRCHTSAAAGGREWCQQCECHWEGSPCLPSTHSCLHTKATNKNSKIKSLTFIPDPCHINNYNRRKKQCLQIMHPPLFHLSSMHQETVTLFRQICWNNIHFCNQGSSLTLLTRTDRNLFQNK